MDGCGAAPATLPRRAQGRPEHEPCGRVGVSNGANDGLLSIVVHTRSQSGIAARSPLALNFRTDYNFVAAKEQDVDEPDTKMFRGVLDSYFARVATESIPCSLQSKEEEKRYPYKARNK